MSQNAIEWLDQQCRSIDAVRSGAMLLADDASDPQLFRWPQDANVSSNLVKLAKSAMERNKPRWTTVNRPDEQGGNTTLLAYPLTYKGEVRGAVTVECDEREERERVHTILTLQSASASLMTAGEESSAIGRGTVPLASVGGPLEKHLGLQSEMLSLIVEALDHQTLFAAASAVVNELAQVLDCRRVSFGVHKGTSCHVRAVSNNADIDLDSTPVRLLTAAMEETVAARTTICIPSTDDLDQEAVIAHTDLVEEEDGASLASIVLVNDEQIVGALLLERSGDNPFDATTIAFLEQVALLVGPVLDLKRRLERPFLERTWTPLRSNLESLLGPRHFIKKFIAAVSTVLVVWLMSVSAEYRVTATATLEPTSKFAITSPFDGYIATSHRKAGDIVTQGETLVSLDQGDMLLEQTKWQSEHAKLTKEYRSALAKGDRAEVRILKNRQGQVQTQLGLLRAQLARSDLTAPIDGMIIQGDLDEMGGSPVQRGQLLFEIARMDEYRVELNVDERDIAGVEPGQAGRLLLASMPDEAIDIVVDSIVPISESGDGINAFVVYAELVDQAGVARPGMAGIAKIDLGSEPLLWIYTHRMLDWIQLQWWKFS